MFVNHTKSHTVALAGIVFGLMAVTALAGGSEDFANMSEAWEKAYNAKDAAGVAALYAEDGVMKPPNADQAKGRQAIEAHLAREMKLVSGRLDIVTVEHGHDGDLGFARGTFSMTDSHGNIVDRGKWVEVRKKVDGRWQIDSDIWNSDMAPGALRLSPAAATFVDVWNNRNYDELYQVLTEDFRRRAPDQNADGRADMKEFMRQVHTTYPDFRIVVDNSSHQGDVAFLHWTVTGTNTGPGAFPPTGERITTSGITMLRFADDGRISEEIAHYDTATVSSQLGLAAVPHAQ
jgi:steroid delta-isomerase-like uncharacterized protein/uncharacterized protein (TIGR02246 family)